MATRGRFLELIHFHRSPFGVLKLLGKAILLLNMEEIRRAAAAYYQNLPEEKKRYARFVFSEMDKNGDGQINLKEFIEYHNKDNNSALTNPSLFRALDKNSNGSLDFEEAKVLYYIMQSGRALFCKSCNTFLTDVYFSCFHCFTSNDSTVSTYEICCDCFGGKKFTHHDDATFCDNYTLLSQGRSLALAAPPEKRSSVLRKIEMTVGVASVVVFAGTIIAPSTLCTIM